MSNYLSTITTVKLILLWAFLMPIVALNAQNSPNLNPCGTTTMPPHLKTWLTDFQQNPRDYRQSGSIKYVPIQFHLVGKNDGSGYFPTSSLFSLMCEVNESYVPIGIQFYIVEPFRYINNSSYYEHDWEDGASMMAQNNVPNVVNVYMVDDPAGNCGYFSDWVDGVAIAHSCATNATVSHELGHFFSLPHTFSGWEGMYSTSGEQLEQPSSWEIERVNGSNCNSAGDGFCDTPADYLSYRWQCPYLGNFADPNGTPIDPDETLFMSYALDACVNRFSLEQQQAVLANVTEVRSNLITNNYQPSTSVDNTYLFYPAGSSAEVKASNANIIWKKAEGATKYYIELLQYEAQNGINIKTYTTDTFYVGTLTPNVTYYLSVQPIGNAYYCTNKVTGAFKTTNTPEVHLTQLNVNMPSCYGSADGGISIAVGGGTPPYTYLWNTGETELSLQNLVAGVYTLTVMQQSNGNTTDLHVILPQPSYINAQTRQTGATSADFRTLAGGSPSYTYLWSSGETTAIAQNLSVGNNSVTITDSHQCEAEFPVYMSQISADITPISCHNEDDASLMLHLEGNPPYSIYWNTGATTETLTNLEGGVYSATITDKNHNPISLTYVIENPLSLQVNVSTAGNSAFAEVVGGTPPYNYYWPTGFSSYPTATDLFPYNYELYVYDVNGCETSTSFTIADVTATQQPDKNQIRILPSVISQYKPQLKIELPANLTTWAISLVQLNGQLIWQTELSAGTTAAMLDLPAYKLTSGMYLMTVNNGQFHYQQKLFVF